MLRSVLFNTFFWPIAVIGLVTIYPFAYFFNQKMAFKLAYRPLTKWLIFCLQTFAGIDHEIKGLNILNKALKNGPVIIGCQHQSTWETFIFSLIFDELAIVVKKELLDIPIAGIHFKKLGCIPIDRSSAVSSIKSLLKFGRAAIDKGQSILIFPNGTRASGDGMAEYKGGVFALYKSLSVPVIPCSVNSGKFWPRRSFLKKKGRIVLEFKETIVGNLQKEEFMELFEKRIG